MSTLAGLRSSLRVLLNDNAAEGYLWGDAALDLYLNDAIREYGRRFPRQRETTVTTVAGQREYDLPADCLAVVRVEVVGAYGRTPLLEDGNDGSGSPAGIGSYQVYGGRLILLPTPTEAGISIAVGYLASHAALASDGDISTVPTADEDLLLAHACAGAILSLSAEEARRQRFEGQAGRPAESVAAFHRQRYEKGIRDRGARVRPGRLVAR